MVGVKRLNIGNWFESLGRADQKENEPLLLRRKLVYGVSFEQQKSVS